MADLEIHRLPCEPWGRTTIKATFGIGDTVALDIAGGAEVTSSEQWFRAIEFGASCRKLHYMFGQSFWPSMPGPPERFVLGMMILYREPRRLVRMRPATGATFSVSIGPADLVIESDDGATIWEVLRTPLKGVSAMALETMLPQTPPPTASFALSASAAAPKLLASA